MTVALAYVHDTEIAHSFHDSVTRMILHDLTGPQHFFGGGENPIKMRASASTLIGAARNKVAKRVFESPDEYEWLFWIDSDMGFEPDTVDKLMAAADPKDRPIVGGLCFVQQERSFDGSGGWRTRAGVTIMDWRQGEKKSGLAGRPWYEPNALTRCDGTGSACILIHRGVLERIHDEFGPTWYDSTRGDDGYVSEDLAFCMRAAVTGSPIFVHTGIRTTHMKTQWLGEPDFWEQQIAPPATEQTAVLVPVLERPQNAAPFMQSLRASTGLATAYAICDVEDTATWEAWSAAGATVLNAATGKTFSKKINVGYRTTTEPWIFVVGDDVRFLPGWLDHAQTAAEITSKHVVGTNDLGNPRVMRGEHATHLLIRRTYVEDKGASWDGPDIVCHEGYRHWFVDDEIVTCAKQRDVWTMSLASKVEHLHPAWGKAASDAVYEVGPRYADRDGKLFAKRLAANGSH